MSSNKVVVSVVGKDGKGVFEPDLIAEGTALPGATIRRFSSLSEIPAEGVNYNAEYETPGVANKKGVQFLECAMAPGSKSPMHTTPSVDFGVMVAGEITFILDSGEEKTLKYVCFVLQVGRLMFSNTFITGREMCIFRRQPHISGRTGGQRPRAL